MCDMPAYFSIDFQYQRANLEETTVKDFFLQLTSCGLEYIGGSWPHEAEKLDEMRNCNQRKLEENFELGFTDTSDCDYRQMLFLFHDFSEVRLFVLNYAEEDWFSFCLIIPEEDFVTYQSSACIRLEHKMCLVEELALRMWQSGKMCCIQTGWEGSSLQTEFSAILKGKSPAIEPFAILPEDAYRPEWECDCERVGRSGVLLRNHNNWEPV